MESAESSERLSAGNTSWNVCICVYIHVYNMCGVCMYVCLHVCICVCMCLQEVPPGMYVCLCVCMYDDIHSTLCSEEESAGGSKSASSGS